MAKIDRMQEFSKCFVYGENAETGCAQVNTEKQPMESTKVKSIGLRQWLDGNYVAVLYSTAQVNAMNLDRKYPGISYPLITP